MAAAVKRRGGVGHQRLGVYILKLPGPDNLGRAGSSGDHQSRNGSRRTDDPGKGRIILRPSELK